MENKRALLKRRIIQLAVIVLVILLGAVMFVVGKEHTILLDNKSIESGGVTYNAFQVVEVQVDGRDKLELGPRDRDKEVVMGQRHKVTVTYFDKYYEEHVVVKKFKVPISQKMVLISLPAVAAELDQSVWLTNYEAPTLLNIPKDEEPIVSDDLIPLDF
ncbi:MAG TPA: hypothetical protein GXZ38_07950 [Spirochaetales bacterium]|jgi:hypothetical protein|nr:hypothetical protein [Spirochaetales bacterium]